MSWRSAAAQANNGMACPSTPMDSNCKPNKWQSIQLTTVYKREIVTISGIQSIVSDVWHLSNRYVGRVEGQPQLPNYPHRA
jgi:hypothetical protein